MAVPIVINPWFKLILKEKLTFTMYPSSIVALNPLLIEGYYLFTIDGKATNWWLQFMNSLPNFLFRSLMVCFNNIVYLRIITKCRPVIVPFLIFPRTITFLNEKFAVTKSFGKRITFDRILLKIYYWFTIIRKITISLL